MVKAEAEAIDNQAPPLGAHIKGSTMTKFIDTDAGRQLLKENFQYRNIDVEKLSFVVKLIDPNFIEYADEFAVVPMLWDIQKLFKTWDFYIRTEEWSGEFQDYVKQYIVKNYLYNHVSKETAYVVHKHLKGYRAITEIRYWIESSRYGDRFVRQTKNPRTGKWCAPKKETYCDAIVFYLDENNRFRKYTFFYTNTTYGREEVKQFLETHKGKLNEWQVKNINKKNLFNKRVEGVTTKSFLQNL